MAEDHHPERFSDELLSAYLDDELSPAERAAVEKRLAEDDTSRALLEELRAASQAVQQLPKEPRDAKLKERILEETSSQSTEATKERAAKLSVGRSARGWIWAAAAIAAALMIMVYQGDPLEDGGRDVADHQPAAEKTDSMAAAPAVAVLESYELGLEPGSATADGRIVDENIVVESDPSEESMARDREVRSFSVLPTPPAAELDALQPAAPESMVSSESSAEPRAGSGVAGVLGAVDDESAGLEVADPQLVVHVTMTPESRENQVFENLLISRKLLPDAPVSRRSLLEHEKAEQPVEAVVVDAPPAEIAACLSSIENDYTNFLAVEVVEQPDSKNVSSSQLQSGEAPTQLSDASSWQRYNRGQVPLEQRAQASRYEAPPKRAEPGDKILLKRLPEFQYYDPKTTPPMLNYRGAGEPRVQALFLLGTGDRELPAVNEKARATVPAPADR